MKLYVEEKEIVENEKWRQTDEYQHSRAPPACDHAMAVRRPPGICQKSTFYDVVGSLDSAPALRAHGRLHVSTSCGTLGRAAWGRLVGRACLMLAQTHA